MAVEILIPLIVFSTIFGVLYTFLTTRNKERLAMIEKGADPSVFYTQRKRLGIKNVALNYSSNLNTLLLVPSLYI